MLSPSFSIPATPRGFGLYPALLPWILLGYAVCGRAFAYIGAEPFYVGEALLLAGILTLASRGVSAGIFFLPQVQALLLFLLWSAMQTVPYLGEYGLFALRDGVLWGYGLFALMTASLLWAQPAMLRVLLARYQWFAHYFPFCALALLAVTAIIPKADFEVADYAQMKPGDALVHLVAILAFLVTGMTRRPRALWVSAFVLAFVIAGSGGRGGLLAFLAGGMMLAALQLHRPAIWRLGAGLAVGLICCAVLLPQLEVFGHFEARRERSVSPMQIADNIVSVFAQSDQDMLEGTKRMRIEWWQKILDDTWFGHEALAGRGYGINLGIEDGFSPRMDESVRHPHNVHMNILARSGMTGLFFWLAFNLVWAAGMFRGVLGARMQGLTEWEGVFTTLLVYQMAALVNASFDVYLEGPMGGIWYWVMMGVGIGALPLYRSMPHLLMRTDGAA